MRATATIVATFTLLFLGQEAKAETLGDMKQQCEQLEDYWRVYPPTKENSLIPDRAGAAICFGFMEAIIGLTGGISIPSLAASGDLHCARTDEGKIVGGPNCGHTLGICPPKFVSYSQVLAVFLAYARSHAAQWHEDAAPQFQSAMMNAFPCKGEYPTPWLDEPAHAR